MNKLQVLRFVVQGHTPMEENEMSDTDRKTISCFPSTDLRFFCKKKEGSRIQSVDMGNRVIGKPWKVEVQFFDMIW